MNCSLSIAARDSGFLIELQGSDGSLVAERFEGANDLFSGGTAIRISDALTRHLGVACITDEQAILNRLRYIQDELMVEDDAKHTYQ